MEESSYKILIIDDEDIMREYLGDIFSDFGYNITKVDSGNCAIELLEKNNFNLVISDLKMSDVDGVDIFNYIIKEKPQTKIILMTAYSMDMSGTNFLEKGAYGFFLKPFNIEQLKSLVQKAYQEHNEE